ncbi:hypothetical protein AgCh_017315 [Apium graveolens]
MKIWVLGLQIVAFFFYSDLVSFFSYPIGFLVLGMELMIASSLYNPLIVPLVGFCVNSDEGLFLLYKYVSGGNLERYLHEKKKGVNGGCSLPWSVRYS